MGFYDIYVEWEIARYPLVIKHGNGISRKTGSPGFSGSPGPTGQALQGNFKEGYLASAGDEPRFSRESTGEVDLLRGVQLSKAGL